MNIAGMQHFLRVERKKEVTDQDASFVRRAIGRDIQDNGGCFSFSLGSLPELRRQPNGCKPTPR